MFKKKVIERPRAKRRKRRPRAKRRKRRPRAKKRKRKKKVALANSNGNNHQQRSFERKANLELEILNQGGVLRIDSKYYFGIFFYLRNYFGRDNFSKDIE
jgi:hypothetical protein